MLGSRQSTLQNERFVMKKPNKKIILALSIVCFVFLLTGCGHTAIQDGQTGVLISKGIVSDEFLTAGRHSVAGIGSEIIAINNKIQTITYDGIIEAQSRDDVIIYASGYGVSFRIGAGEKSVWLIKSVSDYANPIPQSLVENALKDALLQVEGKNATKRPFVEPIFKEILQSRLDEYFDYHNGADTSVVTVTSVQAGNLSPEKAFDEELSRGAILARQKENSILENELNLINRQSELELEKMEREAEADASLYAAQRELEITKLEIDAKANSLAGIKDELTPEVLAYLAIEKWDGHLENADLLTEYFEQLILDAQKGNDS